MLEKSPTVLVVFEDDDTTYEILSKTMEQNGWTVVRAPHTAAEIKNVPDTLFQCDVIMLDILLDPSLDGFEVLKHLVAKGFRGTLVIISANARKMLGPLQALAEGYDIKVAGAFEKPVDWNRLQKVIGTPPRKTD
ncbi:MAG: response regulator [Alphaproteobacteria bacterium]